MDHATDIVLILGSGPNAPRASEWPKAYFDSIVAINNAWRVRPDWDALIFPEDFPADRHPPRVTPAQQLIEADRFVPAQNAYGGFVYAGGTMAFTAAYWALFALRPKVMAFLGCDMVYAASGATHFYGTGTADPLRPDISLRDLGAKSARLGAIAAAQGCFCVNLSDSPSRLLFDRAHPEMLRDLTAPPAMAQAVKPILQDEASLGYFVPSGRYWDEATRFDPQALDRLDSAWHAAWADRVRSHTAA